jgi:hypothetical protein
MTNEKIQYTKEEAKRIILSSFSIGDTRIYEHLPYCGMFQAPIHEVLAEALTELIQEGKIIISSDFLWHNELQPLFKRTK